MPKFATAPSHFIIVRAHFLPGKMQEHLCEYTHYIYEVLLVEFDRI